MNLAPIDDLTLHAWLDDELTPERSKEVEAWLQANPEDAARVRLWAADRELLRTQLAGVLDEPVPAALEQLLWRKTPVRGAWFAAGASAGWQRWAAALAVFALGGMLGAGLMWRAQGQALARADAAEPAWVTRAAVAHAVYVPEVRHPVEVKAQEEHLSRWLTRRLKVPVKLFDLRAQGFELVGGRLLPDAAGPSAQLMYQQIVPAGAPAASGAEPVRPVRVTVYLRQPDRATPAAFRYEQQGALGMFYWVEGATAQGGPCGYALVGELPRERLLAMAEAIYKQGDVPAR
ncbi:MAG: anti-sigma factor [Pseudomonadota bacterium]